MKITEYYRNTPAPARGFPAAAINAHISYVKSASGGMLYASAEEFSINPKIATYTVTVTDDDGEKIAIFQGMVYRKTPRKDRVYVHSRRHMSACISWQHAPSDPFVNICH